MYNEIATPHQHPRERLCDDFIFVAHRLVKTRIFGNRTVHAYVMLSKSGSHRLFFSTVDPMALHMYFAVPFLKAVLSSLVCVVLSSKDISVTSSSIGSLLTLQRNKLSLL
jgi:hypothetical protein